MFGGVFDFVGAVGRGRRFHGPGMMGVTSFVPVLAVAPRAVMRGLIVAE